MAIGNLTSLFLKFYLSDFDNQIASLGYKYGRYVDDLIIVDKDKQKLLDLLGLIKVKFEEIGLTVHPNKFTCNKVGKA